MSFDPKFTFYLGVFVTLAIGLSNGTVHLTNVVPTDWIPYVTGWMGLFSFVGSTLLTGMSGMSSPKSGPIAPPPTVKQAQEVMKTAQEALK